MSFVTAIQEIDTRLTAVGMQAYPDPRVDILSTVDGGQLDNSYLLICHGIGNPWVDTNNTPNLWVADMEIQIVALVEDDMLSSVYKDLAQRHQLFASECVRKPLTEGTIYNLQPSTILRRDKDRRVVSSTRFSMRYAE